MALFFAVARLRNARGVTSSPADRIEISWLTEIQALNYNDIFFALVEPESVPLEFFDVAFVGFPAHPLWLRRQFPCLGVEAAQCA